MTRERRLIQALNILGEARNNRNPGIKGCRDECVAQRMWADWLGDPSTEGDPPNDPAGTVTLTFAGNGAVRLEVECIEAELRDLGPQWRARRKPRHPGS